MSPARSHVRSCRTAVAAALVLECGDGNGSAMPWDRDLVLSGDVRAFPLADLLSLIHTPPASRDILFFEQPTRRREGDLPEPRRGGLRALEPARRSARRFSCCASGAHRSGAAPRTPERRYHPEDPLRQDPRRARLPDAPRSLERGEGPGRGDRAFALLLYRRAGCTSGKARSSPTTSCASPCRPGSLDRRGPAQRRDELLRLPRPARGSAHAFAPCELDAGFNPASENERLPARRRGRTQERLSGVCHAAGLDPRTAARTHLLQLARSRSDCAFENASRRVARDGSTRRATTTIASRGVSRPRKLLLELARTDWSRVDGPAAVAERLEPGRE